MPKKAFKYRLSPTRKQEQKLFWTLARCRELYNAALSERKDAYTYEHKSMTYRMQADDLPEIKGVLREEYQDIHSQILQDVLKSQCGTVRKKNLDERWHSCECGCELDRDTNAAINILRLGRSQRVPLSRASVESRVEAPPF